MLERLSVKVNIEDNKDVKYKQKLSKHDMWLYIVNGCIALIFWLVKDLGWIPFSILAAYEILYIFAIVKRKISVKMWALILPFSTAFFPLGYIFLNTSQTLEITRGVFPLIAVMGGILIWLLIRKRCKIHSIWLSELLLIGILVISLMGQIIQANHVFHRNTTTKLYCVENKWSEDLYKSPIKLYFISIKSEKEVFEVQISSSLFKQIKIDDKFPLTVYNGGLGAEYLKDVPKELKAYINNH